MASSSSPRPRDDNSANSPNNSKIDIAEHDEEFAAMTSSSLPLSVIDDSPNNLNCSTIDMVQNADEYASVSSLSLSERNRIIEIDHLTDEFISVVSSSSSGKMLKTMFVSISV